MKKHFTFLLFLILIIVFDSCSGGSSPQTLPVDQFLNPGDYYKSIDVDGFKRTFLVHIPDGYSLTVSHSVVFALHGGGGSADKMVKLTKGGFNTLSEKDKFLVIYPEAIENHWNDGRGLDNYYSQRENVDDVKFLSQLIDYCVKEYKVSPHRVYFTGMSNGALMCFRLISELSDKITAVAPVCGSIPENIFPNYNPQYPLSVLIINGTDDPLVPWDGGEITFGDLKLGEVLPIEQIFDYLGEAFVCAESLEREYLPDVSPEDGTRVWLETYVSCKNNVVVTLCGIEGGGHTWPSGYHYLPESIVGRTSLDIDGCDFIWDFFKDKVR